MLVHLNDIQVSFEGLGHRSDVTVAAVSTKSIAEVVGATSSEGILVSLYRQRLMGDSMV